MKLKAKIYGMTKDILSGQNLLTIAYEGKIGDEIDKLTDKDLSVKIEPYRKKRSKNANAYMWALCDEIAEAVGSTKKAVYRTAVKDVGIYRDFTLQEIEAQSFRVAWEMHGDGWITEQVDYAQDGERVVIRAYFGSSMYNTKQMSRLIEYLVIEAETQGITVMSEQERSLLYEDWKQGEQKWHTNYV